MNQLQAQLAISLLAAHVLSDFVLQSDKGVRTKERFGVLLRHCLVVASLSYVLLGLWPVWTIPLTLFVTHFVLDFAKTRYWPVGLRSFALDQTAHVAIILILSFLSPRTMPVSQVTFWQSTVGGQFYVSLIVLTGFFAVTHAGSVLVGLGVEPFLTEQIREGVSSDTSAPGTVPATRKGFEQGGKIIGQLERAMIFLLVLVGQPSAIGFLIAAKSLLRFGEIGAGASRKEIEYIIIGTFMSFLVAMAGSYLTRLALLAYQSSWPAA